MAALAVSSCGDDFTDCKLGQLTGTWRTTYVHLNGSCGYMPSETMVYRPGQKHPACEYYRVTISSDLCRADIDTKCPTTDGLGTQEWIGVIRHVDTGRLEWSATLQITHSKYGPCRSTYDIVSEAL